MSDHTFRGQAGETIDPRREAIRRKLPDGKEGFVVEDIDLANRVFGNNFQTDAIGLIRLIEFKLYPKDLETSKQMTFGLLDAMANTSPMSERYQGFYLVQSDLLDWLDEETKFWINYEPVTRLEFWRWLKWEDYRPPLDLGLRFARQEGLA